MVHCTAGQVLLHPRLAHELQHVGQHIRAAPSEHPAMCVAHQTSSESISKSCRPQQQSRCETLRLRGRAHERPTCCCTSHTATLNQHAQPSMQANSDASRRGSHKLASSSHQAMATGAPADSSAPVKNVVNTMPRQPAMPQQQATAVQQGQENSKAAQNLSPTRYTDTPHLPTNMKPALHQHTWKHF